MKRKYALALKFGDYDCGDAFLFEYFLKRIGPGLLS